MAPVITHSINNLKLPILLRAPGRVNLIGEHVDYCGFPVLPIAIQQDVVIAGRTDQTDRTLTVCNTDSCFQEYSCSIRDVQVWGICCSCSIRDVQVLYGIFVVPLLLL